MGHYLISKLFILREEKTTCMEVSSQKPRHCPHFINTFYQEFCWIHLWNSVLQDWTLSESEEDRCGEDHKEKVFQSLTEHTVSIKNFSKLVEKNHSVCENNSAFIHLY